MSSLGVDTSVSEPLDSRPSPSKKDYQGPSLVDWGSLVELTGGPAFDINDCDFSGSGSI